MNFEAAAEKSGMDVADLELLFEVFKTTAVESMRELRGSIEANDASLTRAALHKIAGSTASLFGLEDLNTCARAAEREIIAGNPVDSDAIFTRLANLLKQAEIDV
ncbi:MAG: Hpt domain-containing protein [Helicobacteraceae bacterium]|jgi:HPt (histidine-containing phosphotransfer) domain-containing protein|nr:Hpt domain-containing protein [Helicobacteraceae bacterium]